jgi:hypothetical protein
MGTMLCNKTILLSIEVAQKLVVFCFETFWQSPLPMCAIFVPTGGLSPSAPRFFSKLFYQTR